jgi:hypothetical protein
MACHVLTLPNGGTAIVCCPRPRRRKCSQCGCPDAKALCDWPMLKPVRFEPFDAIAIDQVLNQEGGWRCHINDIVRARDIEAILIHGLVLDLGKWAAGALRRSLPFETSFSIGPGNFQKFRVEAPATCDKPCCFRCRIHVGDDRDYCSDHWDQMRAGSLVLRNELPTGKRSRVEGQQELFR